MTGAFRSSHHEGGVFRLLVPAGDTAPSGAPSLETAGRRWRPVDHGAVPLPADGPEYNCVSYSWGRGRTPNPFDPDRPMSDRALPALETAIVASEAPPPAVWLDAVCMPTKEAARSLCLRSMGAIYAAASGVLVVLSSSASSVLHKVRRGEALGLDDLRLLEADHRVGRAWTYQEMANNNAVGLVAEGDTAALVVGNKLFNAIGHAITHYRRAERVDAYEFRKRQPRLDALETLTDDDWLMAGYPSVPPTGL